MTEFAIVLPVFILIWLGGMHLTQLERVTMRAKIEATIDTWHNAMKVADGGLIPADRYGNPVSAAADATQLINQTPRQNGDYSALSHNLGLSSGATQSEAQYSTMAASMVGQSPSGTVPGGGLSRYSRDMLDDSRPNMLSSKSNKIGRFNYVVPVSAGALGYNQVPALGLRYGMVMGQGTQSGNIAGINYSIRQVYDVGNSPVSSAEDMMVVGFSRMMAEDDSCLKNILKFKRSSSGYRSNCR